MDAKSPERTNPAAQPDEAARQDARRTSKAPNLKSRTWKAWVLLFASGVAIFSALNWPKPQAQIGQVRLDQPDDRFAANASEESLEATHPIRRRQKFFRDDVGPTIDQNDDANREAIELAVQRIEDRIDVYRRGIDPFVSDVTSWRTRFGVIGRLPADWWNGTDKTGAWVAGKMSEHVFDDAKLNRDLEVILDQFREDVVANRRKMVGDIKALVRANESLGVVRFDSDVFAKSVNADLVDYAGQTAKRSVVQGVLIEIAGMAGGLAVEQLVAQVVVRLSAMAATTSAAAGGATATSAAAGGGGGGILGGPVGAGIGIAGGILVGIVIDWWASKRFEANIRQQLHRALDEIRDALLHGDGQSAGLTEALHEASDQIRRAHQSILYQQIVFPDLPPSE
ncbi:MAG: hypothetical protein AAF958_16490 [Planctomycetota bacterium]